MRGLACGGERAIVTAIGPGIGSHIAEAFAGAGANVLLNGRTGRQDECSQQLDQRESGHGVRPCLFRRRRCCPVASG